MNMNGSHHTVRKVSPMQKVISLGLLFGALSLAGIAGASAQTPARQAAAAPALSGPQVCLTCHGSDPKVTSILHTKMAVTGDKRTPFAMGGCQTCHGPSLDHIQGKVLHPDIVFSGPNASPVAERNEICLTCHQTEARMNWKGSAHQRNDIACTNCHNAHAEKDPVLVKFAQPKICFTCHKDIRADSYKYSHHPMREGKVACSDCHNPHGTPGDTKLLKEFTINETCYNCHADKRGPLLWEHQPVRENCLNCHTPHGSNQARLMIEPMNFLCSSCHSAEDHNNRSGGAFGGARSIPTSPLGNSSFSSALANQRTCLNCHSQVHGSNSPGGAYFIR